MFKSLVWSGFLVPGCKGVSHVDFLIWGWLVSPPQMPTTFFSDLCEKYHEVHKKIINHQIWYHYLEFHENMALFRSYL